MSLPRLLHLLQFLVWTLFPAHGAVSIARLQRKQISEAATLIVGEFFDPTTATKNTIEYERRAVCARLDRHFGAKDTAYFVAQDAGNIVGFVEVALSSDHAAALAREQRLPPRPRGLPKVTALTVAPSHRRRGVGTLLLTACARQSEAWLQVPRGCGELFLEVKRDNAPARGLYTSLGFVECPATTAKAFGADAPDDAPMVYFFGPRRDVAPPPP